jgi:hypothetical protein
MAGKRRLDWKHVITGDEHGLVDLIGNVAQCDKCISYAYTEITVAEPVDALLLLGVDDSERIWVNGDKVFDKFVGRGLQIDEDKVLVKLKTGKNAILLEIWQDVGGWVFCARLTTTAGQPLAFTQKSEN